MHETTSFEIFINLDISLARSSYLNKTTSSQISGGGGGSLQKLLHNSVAQKWVRAVSYELKSH